MTDQLLQIFTLVQLRSFANSKCLHSNPAAAAAADGAYLNFKTRASVLLPPHPLGNFDHGEGFAAAPRTKKKHQQKHNHLIALGSARVRVRAAYLMCIGRFAIELAFKCSSTRRNMKDNRFAAGPLFYFPMAKFRGQNQLIFREWEKRTPLF